MHGETVPLLLLPLRPSYVSSSLDVAATAATVSLTMTVVCYVDRFPRSRKPVQFRRLAAGSGPPPEVCDKPRKSCELCKIASRNSKIAPVICSDQTNCNLCQLAARNATHRARVNANNDIISRHLDHRCVHALMSTWGGGVHIQYIHVHDPSI